MSTCQDRSKPVGGARGRSRTPAAGLGWMLCTAGMGRPGMRRPTISISSVFNFIPDLQRSGKYLGNIPATLLLFPFFSLFLKSMDPFIFFLSTYLCWFCRVFLLLVTLTTLHFLTMLFDYIRYTTHHWHYVPLQSQRSSVFPTVTWQRGWPIMGSQ